MSRAVGTTDLPFRWFQNRQPSVDVFDHRVFAHNRDRLGLHGFTHEFFDLLVMRSI